MALDENKGPKKNRLSLPDTKPKTEEKSDIQILKVKLTDMEMKLNALEEAIQIQNGIMEQIVSKVGVVKLLEATLESRTQSLNAEIKMINDTQEIFDTKLTRNTRILTNTKPVNSKNFASQSCSTQTEVYKEGNSISMESISRATQTTGLASIETGPQPQPLFVEPQTLTTKHVNCKVKYSFK